MAGAVKAAGVDLSEAGGLEKRAVESARSLVKGVLLGHYRI